jgi:acetate kinase
MRILVVNAGSSSLKLSLLDGDDELVGSSELTAHGGQFDAAELQPLLDRWDAAGPPDVVGHRVVHGGSEFTGPVRLDDAVRAKLDALTDLAPLHQPKSLTGIDVVSRALPGVPAVACFDTAFHATMPPAASTYALPADWRQRWQIKRYGFHGLSHAYATRRVSELIGHPPPRLVVCHLGSGASLAAVRDGRSVDTTMGFTPLEGLVMGTRSGTVDPGLVLWLIQHEKISPDELETALEQDSGLQGLGGTSDMRQVLGRAADGDDRAELALEVYLHRLCGLAGSMAAALNGLDHLVFTGGVGEHAPEIRRWTAGKLRFLGVQVDARRNDSADGDTEITEPGAPVRTFVIAAREDLEIARQVREILGP